MKLFHETQNKYYELLSLMINKKDEYSDKEISELLESNMIGEIDYDVVDTLFSKKDGEEAVYMYDQGVFVPAYMSSMPIRNTIVEQEALYNAVINPYAKHFLTEDTLHKLMAKIGKEEASWLEKDIFVRNQFEHGIGDSDVAYAEEIRTISRAIKEHRAIKYNNIVPGKFEYIGAEIYPIMIEYSFINDVFRISGFDNSEQRFIKMNLSSMSNIILTEKTKEDLDKEYKDYLDANTVSVTLDIEPRSDVIERCFRIFSYYNRKARYDETSDKYQLQISYLIPDEAEVIKGILSLGGYAVVLEPRKLQKEVYRRIKIAKSRYEE